MTARGDSRGGGTNLCLAASLPHVQGAQRAIPGLQSGPHLTDLGLTDGSTKEIREMVVRAA